MPPPIVPGGMDNFAHQQGDPNGNMSYDESKAWAEAFARANPGWTGNETFVIDPKTGEAQDTRSWFARNGWIVPVLVGAGIAAPYIAGAVGSGGGASTGAATSTGSGAGAAGATGAGAAIPTIPYTSPAWASAPISVPAGTTAATGAGAGTGILGRTQQVGSILQRLAPVLGGASEGRAGQTANQNSAWSQFDRNALDRANSMDRSILDRATLDLKQREHKLSAPGTRLSTAARGSLAANASPTQVSTGAPMTMGSGATVNPVQFSSPLSAINQDTKDLGSMVSSQMLEDQTAGDDFAPLPNVDFPEPTPPKDGGFMQDALDYGSLISGVGGALASPTLNRLLSRYRSGG